jgi:hypothetical protein
MDKLTELSKKYGENPYLRGVINIIPSVGGSLDIFLTEKWNKFYQKRIENMLDQLSNDMKKIGDKVDVEYLGSEEFFDIIYKILQEAIQTRLDDKRKLYSKIMRDAISNEIPISETESMIEIISNLYEKDLFLIYKIEEYLNTSSLKVDLSGEELHIFLSNQSYDLNEVVRYLYRFSYLGLMDYKTNVLTLRQKIRFSKNPLFNKIHEYLKE